jgi:hypothetical protein
MGEDGDQFRAESEICTREIREGDIESVESGVWRIRAKICKDDSAAEGVQVWRGWLQDDRIMVVCSHQRIRCRRRT